VQGQGQRGLLLVLGLRVRQLLGEGVGEVLLLLGLGLLGQVQGQQLLVQLRRCCLPSSLPLPGQPRSQQ